MDKTSLGDRIKSYESLTDQALMRRVPVIVRVDGKGFSRWTKSMNCEKPFDHNLSTAMAQTMLAVASNIEGCVVGYTQSDEITFVIRNDQSLESEPWFGNRIQKIASIVASMTTAQFNAYMGGTQAYFDARVFQVPSVSEAANVLVWRQNDATKNSISSATYYEVSNKVGRKTARKKMHGLNQKQQQELLFSETGINWNDYPTKYKRGIACYRVSKTITGEDGVEYVRRPWQLDDNIPIFAADREFVLNIIEES